MFGPEWTFTGPGVIESDSINSNTLAVLKKLALKIQSKCPICQLDESSFPEIEIRIRRDLKIRLTLDSRVIEINATPMTTSTMELHKDLLQELIWNSAREIGLAPHTRLGGGHLHIQKPYQPQLNPVMDTQRPYSWFQRLFNKVPQQEYSSLIDSPDILLMRNFLVDLWNRPALFLGALGFNLKSAQPLSSYSPVTLELIQRKVLEFDRGDIGIESLIRYHNALLAPSGDSRNLAINLEHDRTIEIRGLRPQQSFMDYLRLCQLFESRIRALALSPQTPVKLDIPQIKTWKESSQGSTIYLSSLSDDEVRQELKRYVESANQDWEKYKHFPLISPASNLESPESLRPGSLSCRSLF